MSPSDREGIVGTLETWVAVVGTVALIGAFLSAVRTERERVVERLDAAVDSLADAVERDGLTRLLNRRGFETALPASSRSSPPTPT